MTALIALKPFQIVEELATTPLPPTKTHNTHTHNSISCASDRRQQLNSHCFSATITTLKNRLVEIMSTVQIHFQHNSIY